MCIDEMFKSRPCFVSGKRQCGDWTVPVVHWDGKANSNSELCSLVEELLLRLIEVNFARKSIPHRKGSEV
ncbi:hypothetical protein ACVWXM_006924 [Bradyrhizobium sp. GM7.3]